MSCYAFPTPSAAAQKVIDRFKNASNDEILISLITQPELMSQCKLKYHPFASFFYSLESFDPDNGNLKESNFGERLSYDGVSYTSLTTFQNVINLQSTTTGFSVAHNTARLYEVVDFLRTSFDIDHWPCGTDPKLETITWNVENLVIDKTKMRFIKMSDGKISCLSKIHPYEDSTLLPSQVCDLLYRTARQKSNTQISLTLYSDLKGGDLITYTNAENKSSDLLNYAKSKMRIAPLCGEDFIPGYLRSSLLDKSFWSAFNKDFNHIPASYTKALMSFYVAYKRSKNGKGDPIPFCSDAAALGAAISMKIDKYINCLVFASLSSNYIKWQTPTKTWANSVSTATQETFTLFPRVEISTVVSRFLTYNMIQNNWYIITTCPL